MPFLTTFFKDDVNNAMSTDKLVNYTNRYW